MADQRVPRETRDPPRETRDPIIIALGMALREIAERRALERAGRRRTMAVVQGGKRGGAAA